MMIIEAVRQTEIVPPQPGYVPPAWMEWIKRVAPLVPDLPPPSISMIRADGKYGPPDEWMDWIRLAADRLPDIPLPEKIPKKRSALVYVAVVLAIIYVAKKF